MGLDIFFYKVKKVRNSKNEPLNSIEYYNSLKDKRAKDKINAYARRSLARLAKANGMEYESVYKSIFPNGIAKYTPFEFQYSKMCESVKPYPEVEQFFKRFVDYYFDNLKEIINTMEKLKTDYNDDTDIIFVSMSW